MRLDSGQDSGLFWKAIDFESFVSLLLIAINAELASLRDKVVANQCGQSTRIRGQARQEFAFVIWYSCASYVFTRFVHEFFFCESIAKCILPIISYH